MTKDLFVRPLELEKVEKRKMRYDQETETGK